MYLLEVTNCFIFVPKASPAMPVLSEHLHIVEFLHVGRDGILLHLLVVGFVETRLMDVFEEIVSKLRKFVKLEFQDLMFALFKLGYCLHKSVANSRSNLHLVILAKITHS